MAVVTPTMSCVWMEPATSTIALRTSVLTAATIGHFLSARSPNGVVTTVAGGGTTLPNDNVSLAATDVLFLHRGTFAVDAPVIFTSTILTIPPNKPDPELGS